VRGGYRGRSSTYARRGKSVKTSSSLTTRKHRIFFIRMVFFYFKMNIL